MVAALLTRGQWRGARAGEDPDLGSAENDSKIFMDGLVVRGTRYVRLLAKESPGSLTDRTGAHCAFAAAIKADAPPGHCASRPV